MLKSHDFQKSLLKWYDKHRRELPWRSEKGVSAEPYHVWLSEIMLQQTTVPHVIPYFQKFLKQWPSLKKFAAAESADVMREWAGLGYYARARNLHKCAQVLVSEHKGKFPDTEDGLLQLPGIGPYTAAAISSIAFNNHAVVIDANVDRVTTRIFAITKPVKEVKPLIREKAAQIYEGTKRAGDLAQALMDLGSAICILPTPKCGICPVSEFCSAYKKGLQNAIPAKAVKAAKPKREGRAYWLETPSGKVIVETRDEKRMLGGMIGLPGTGWDGKSDSKIPLTKLEYIGDVYHGFTHFDLKLEIWRGRLKEKDVKNLMAFEKSKIASAGLPSVFKKIVKVMLSHEN